MATRRRAGPRPRGPRGYRSNSTSASLRGSALPPPLVEPRSRPQLCCSTSSNKLCSDNACNLSIPLQRREYSSMTRSPAGTPLRTDRLSPSPLNLRRTRTSDAVQTRGTAPVRTRQRRWRSGPSSSEPACRPNRAPNPKPLPSPKRLRRRLPQRRSSRSRLRRWRAGGGDPGLERGREHGGTGRTAGPHGATRIPLRRGGPPSR